MPSQKKRDLEFKKAEEVYVANLLRLMGQIFLVTPQRDSRKINIAKDLKREVVKKRIELITAPLFYLGIAHADELIQEYQPKTLSAGRAQLDLAAATPTSYNEMLITLLTKHTVDSMTYIANNTRQDLIKSLNEGYVNGEGIPALTKRVQAEWITNKVSAKRFARTFTNEVYNQAHFNRYQESSTVDGIQFSAHLDSRTSEQCRMLNRTIWAKGDPAIQTPPLHFNCLVAGTKIKIFNGLKNIEDIQIGDMVLTHANRYRPVTDTMSRMAEELIEIKTENRNLKITPNHPVLTLRNNIYEWVPAGELKVGDNIIIAK
jgi:SPP1 gp7 family putative phage head morphogenesis protein